MPFDDIDNLLEFKVLMKIVLNPTRPTDLDLMDTLGINHEEVVEIIRSLERKGYIETTPLKESYMRPNNNKIEETKDEMRILTYICRKKTCYYFFVKDKYGVDPKWFSRKVKKWKNQGYLLVTKNLKGKYVRITLEPTDNLSVFLNSFLEGDEKHWYIDGDELIHYTSDLLKVVECCRIL